MSTALSIGEVARRTDVAPTTLRYYEKIGLLTPPSRAGGQRRYDDAVLSRLEVIGLCKAAGFTLAEIDTQMATLARARGIIEWAMACTCLSIDTCTCGIHCPEALKPH